MKWYIPVAGAVLWGAALSVDQAYRDKQERGDRIREALQAQIINRDQVTTAIGSQLHFVRRQGGCSVNYVDQVLVEQPDGVLEKGFLVIQDCYRNPAKKIQEEIKSDSPYFADFQRSLDDQVRTRNRRD